MKTGYESILDTWYDKQSDEIQSRDFLFLEAESYESLSSFPVDIFIMVASMQEMNIKVVQEHMDYMRFTEEGKPYFYCYNVVGKTLPDGETIRLADYGWRAGDDICPWYQHFPKSTAPFWAPFDGPIQHRFVKLAKA